MLPFHHPGCTVIPSGVSLVFFQMDSGIFFIQRRAIKGWAQYFGWFQGCGSDLPMGFNVVAALLLLLVLYWRAHLGERVWISASQTCPRKQPVVHWLQFILLSHTKVSICSKVTGKSTKLMIYERERGGDLVQAHLYFSTIHPFWCLCGAPRDAVSPSSEVIAEWLPVKVNNLKFTTLSPKEQKNSGQVGRDA